MATFTAAQNGNWATPTTWGTAGTYPASTDTIIIPAGITVTVDQLTSCGYPGLIFVQLYSTGNLTINGTLILNLVSSSAFVGPPTGIAVGGNGAAQYRGGSITVGVGGQLQISATGYPNYNAHGVIVQDGGSLVNNGTITIQCSAQPGPPTGLAFGIRLEFDGTIDNFGTISTNKVDANSGDGHGTCVGVDLSTAQCKFTNHKLGKIAATLPFPAGAAVRVAAGTLASSGTITSNSSSCILYTGGAFQLLPPTGSYWANWSLNPGGSGKISASQS
ncbi:MAG: hypothetical protein HZA93_05810 [Verrucomicrobia bacterium]|nr:hypothetical protein [Verrucomicrobiota bacterium]